MAVSGSLILVFVRTVRSKDDGPAGRERSVSPQSVSEDQPGGGNRESREHSQQVTRASSCSLCFSQRFRSETQNRGSRNGLKKPGCHFPTRVPSICDDTSSELQRVAALDPHGGSSRNSFQRTGAISR